MGISCIAAAGGAVGLSRFGSAALVTLGIVTAVVLIVSITPLSEAIASGWVRNDRVPQTGLDAVVALSASLNPDSTISGEALDHLLLAAEVVRADDAPILVSTTTIDRYPPGPIVSTIDQERIVQLIGPKIRWLRTSVTTSTHDEALASLKLLKPTGAQRIAVVASPVHTRRACATFEAVGFTVTCIASRNRDPNEQILSQRPRDRIAIFGAWLYELAATAKYQMHEWLPRPPTR
ncbi:MAG TPA: YdcF family protein [Gemmatimonadaceae bacterium]|nr:YdcF family protein [Gemmatimonadaceae bacterium]